MQVNKVILDYILMLFMFGCFIVELCDDLMNCIFNDFIFDLFFLMINILVSYVFEYKWGVCQDYVYLMFICLCSIGLVVCYVSGYIEMILLLGQEKFIGVDVIYVWVVFFVLGFGWIDYDLINNLKFYDQYVMLVVG